MSEKTEQLEREITSFISEQKQRADLNENQLAELSRWGTYANRTRSELGTRAAIGAISPAEYEQALDALANEVIGHAGAVTMDATLKKWVAQTRMSEAEYAVKRYRGENR